MICFEPVFLAAIREADRKAMPDKGFLLAHFLASAQKRGTLLCIQPVITRQRVIDFVRLAQCDKPLGRSGQKLILMVNDTKIPAERQALHLDRTDQSLL